MDWDFTKLFSTRSQARDSAKRAGLTNFRTMEAQAGFWRYEMRSGTSPAAAWAQDKDFVSHVETDEGQGIVVVLITKEELAAEALDRSFRYEPITPSLWSGHGPSNPGRVNDDDPKPRRSTTGGASPSGTRAKSDVESPTKLVWQLADEMTGASRAQVIAACVEKGVNKATASTQFYRWQKARSDKSA